ncbi:MAG TPA: Glu/Leu/Phe/Val dehydrogenase [Terriglobales bacterium]|nr:Glu/Leu/Phe/Val dehydrogenase [Terriglobales bacterium]
MISDTLLPTAETEDFDPLVQATLHFETAARHLDLEAWIVQRLRHPERELSLNLPLITNDGLPLMVTAYRVQHCTWQGPGLGGVRYSPDVRLSHVRAAAMTTTWECALFDLPFGGSAGAIVCDPQRLSERELRDVTKEYVYALRGIAGPATDVLAPGIGSNAQTAAWMFDGFIRAAGHMEAAAVTGKPEGLWGLPAFDALVARNLFLLLEQVLLERGGLVRGATVAVQGFGKLGGAAARLLYDAGARVVAIADLSGGLHNPHGLDIAELQSYVETNHVMLGFPRAEAATNEQVLETSCDLLVAAADEHQITAANAARVHAGVVVEAVQETITPAADRILADRGVLVVPDILANSTRLLASVLEWSRNQRGLCRTNGDVEAHMKDCIQRAYLAVHDCGAREHIGLRAAAHLLAVDRIASALRARH